MIHLIHKAVSIFQVKLVEVERVEWINKKNYSTVALVLGRDGRVLLRAANGLEDWFELLEVSTFSQHCKWELLK
jgi:hypothetical protein